MVIILTPALDDSANADSWQTSYNQYADNFRKLGAHVESEPWPTSPSSSDSSSSIYVAVLTWGYHLNRDQWDEWLDNWPPNVRLINSPKLLTWNTSKTYLEDLKRAGLPTIPTIYVPRVDETILDDAAKYFGVADLIIKPQVSASSHNMKRVLVGSNDFTSAPSKIVSINYKSKSFTINFKRSLERIIINILLFKINYYLSFRHEDADPSWCILFALSIFSGK
jgi:hypothetical protein